MNNKVFVTVSIVAISVVVMIILTMYWPKNLLPIEPNNFFRPVKKNISKIPKEIFLDLSRQNTKEEPGPMDPDKKPSITKLGIFTDLEIMRDFFITDTAGESGILESNKHEIHKAIAKNGHFIPETKTERSFLYYFPETNDFTWSVENNWLLRDITNDKYYVPEGLIKFDKDLLFEWTPLKNIDSEKEIEFIIIS